MTLRVIEGGGEPDRARTNPAEAARAAVLDRVAGAIYANDDPAMDWETFKTRARVDPDLAFDLNHYNQMASGAVHALKPTVENDDDLDIACGAYVASTTGQPPSVVLMCAEAWIDEVLK